MPSWEIAEFRRSRWFSRRWRLLVRHFDASFSEVIGHGAWNAHDQKANFIT